MILTDTTVARQHDWVLLRWTQLSNHKRSTSDLGCAAQIDGDILGSFVSLFGRQQLALEPPVLMSGWFLWTSHSCRSHCRCYLLRIKFLRCFKQKNRFMVFSFTRLVFLLRWLALNRLRSYKWGRPFALFGWITSLKLLWQLAFLRTEGLFLWRFVCLWSHLTSLEDSRRTAFYFFKHWLFYLLHLLVIIGGWQRRLSPVL